MWHRRSSQQPVPREVLEPWFAERACPRTSSSSRDRKSTRLNSSHSQISYAVFCLKKNNHTHLSNLSYLSNDPLNTLAVQPLTHVFFAEAFSLRSAEPDCDDFYRPTLHADSLAVNH